MNPCIRPHESHCDDGYLKCACVDSLGEIMDSAHEEGVQPPRQDPLKIDRSEVQDISTSPDTDTTNSAAPAMPREDAAPAPEEKTPNVTPKPGQSHRICVFSIYTLTLMSFKYK